MASSTLGERERGAAESQEGGAALWVPRGARTSSLELLDALEHESHAADYERNDDRQRNQAKQSALRARDVRVCLRVCGRAREHGQNGECDNKADDNQDAAQGNGLDGVGIGHSARNPAPLLSHLAQCLIHGIAKAQKCGYG